MVVRTKPWAAIQKALDCVNCCDGTPEEVEANARSARRFEPLSQNEMLRLEMATKPHAARFASYKSLDRDWDSG